jgi:hypothetical protein
MLSCSRGEKQASVCEKDIDERKGILPPSSQVASYSGPGSSQKAGEEKQVTVLSFFRFVPSAALTAILHFFPYLFPLLTPGKGAAAYCTGLRWKVLLLYHEAYSLSTTKSDNCFERNAKTVYDMEKSMRLPKSQKSPKLVC